MKCITIFVSVLSALAATTASTVSDGFDEQVLQTHLRGSNGVPTERLVKKVPIPGTQRGKDWLSSNQSYINATLQWNGDLKTKAASYASQGVNNNCQFPTITLDRTVNGQLSSGGMATNLVTLPSTEQIFQGWEKSNNVNLKSMSNMKKVGCGDALRKSSTGVMGCFMSICLYSF
ncbi:hypothetical protein ACHAW6_014416 [Cyclotella cf. meneghiniana]